MFPHNYRSKPHDVLGRKVKGWSKLVHVLTGQHLCVYTMFNPAMDVSVWTDIAD